jgi:hypothetical protein
VTNLQIETVQLRQAKVGNLVQIGRMVSALLFGLLGGIIARALAQWRESPAGLAGQGGTE